MIQINSWIHEKNSDDDGFSLNFLTTKTEKSKCWSKFDLMISFEYIENVKLKLSERCDVIG